MMAQNERMTVDATREYAGHVDKLVYEATAVETLASTADGRACLEKWGDVVKDHLDSHAGKSINFWVGWRYFTMFVREEDDDVDSSDHEIDKEEEEEEEKEEH